MAGNNDSPQSSGGLKKLKLMEEMVKSIEGKASAPSLYGVWTKTLSRELRVVLNIISDEQAQAPKERKLEILQQLDDILQNLSEIMTKCGQLMDELHCRSKMTVFFTTMIFRRAGDLKRIKELRAEVKSTKAEVEWRFIRLKSAWPKPAEPTEMRSEERLNNQQGQRSELLSMNAPSSVTSRASAPLATSTTNLNSAIIYDGRFSTSGRDTYLVYDYSQTTIIHHHADRYILDSGHCVRAGRERELNLERKSLKATGNGPNEVAMMSLGRRNKQEEATSYGLIGLGRMSHSQKVHSYHAIALPPLSSQAESLSTQKGNTSGSASHYGSPPPPSQVLRKTSAAALLKSLTKSGNGAKITNTQGLGGSQIKAQKAGRRTRDTDTGLFSVAKIFVFPLGLVLDDDDFPSLALDRLKFDDNVFTCLNWTHHEVQTQLLRYLNEPMEHLAQLGEEEGMSQWRLLHLSTGYLKLIDNDTPDGAAARCLRALFFLSLKIILVSMKPFAVDIMREISGLDWERHARRLLKKIGWEDEFDAIFPSAKGKKRVLPDSSDEENLEQNQPDVEDAPPKQTLTRQAKKARHFKRASGTSELNDDLTGGSKTSEFGQPSLFVPSPISVPDSDSDDDYTPPQPSSPIPQLVVKNVWDLKFPLNFVA
ncbi:hypothetical protein D9757_002558 [Collybiopsis confluens]|uniref:Uncharacterized protein n=1 Tax=Collybiopsis confluens TaxID=2823264 RepID=A0A8H5HYG2_9AGAR|nr:hypothetical protein D9757_002558 [Collybiopsis confluens]